MTKMHLLGGAFVALGGLVVVACSGDDRPAASTSTTTTTTTEGGIPTVDGGRNDASLGPDADGGAVSCNVPALGAASVNAHVIAGSPPTDTGGAIAAGTYDLTVLEVYVEQGGEDPDASTDAGANMDTARATLVITTDALSLSKNATPFGGGAPLATSFVANQHVSDVFLFTDETCPGTDSH